MTSIQSVEAHDVEHGDILAGVPLNRRHPIESILWSATEQYDGTRGAWIYADAHGKEMGRCQLGGRIQVVRGVGPDHCPPRGIARRNGMYVVTP